MTATQLADLLATVEPVELKGLALLQRRRPRAGQTFPDVSARAMADAAAELIDYQLQCSVAMDHLVHLPPVALDISIEEWPL